MQTPDVWDTTPSSQRKNTRYLARWKAALVFDNATNKPIFQTLTHDLSMHGISLQYHSQERLQSVLSLLLAPPPINGIPQKIIKLRAMVVSSIPFRGAFRLGMTFIQDAELEKLQTNFDLYVVSEDSLISHPEAEAFPKLDL